MQVYELLLDSFNRLLHLKLALEIVLKKVDEKDGGRYLYSKESTLDTIKDTFNKAIKNSELLLNDIKLTLTEIHQCGTVLREFELDPNIVKAYDYTELTNWVIFREYANQLEFNIAAFKILVERINESKTTANGSSNDYNNDASVVAPIEPWQIPSRRRRQKEVEKRFSLYFLSPSIIPSQQLYQKQMVLSEDPIESDVVPIVAAFDVLEDYPSYEVKRPVKDSFFQTWFKDNTDSMETSDE